MAGEKKQEMNVPKALARRKEYLWKIGTFALGVLEEKQLRKEESGEMFTRDHFPEYREHLDFGAGWVLEGEVPGGVYLSRFDEIEARRRRGKGWGFVWACV